MENNQKGGKPTIDAMKGYNPTDRDFQRTEEETDNISQSEKEELNKNTAEANTKPEKDKLNN